MLTELADHARTFAPFVLIGLLGAVAYSLHLIWKFALCPTWRLFVNVNAFAEALPVLLEIAEEFKPNGGDSLRDQIDAVSIRLGNIEQQLEEICREGRQ